MRTYVSLLISLGSMAACDGDERAPVIFMMEGHSMVPTVEDGERHTVFGYSGGVPARGDLVVFAAPTSPDRLFLKRIIGLPGDVVEIEAGGGVWVNGAVLDEPYAQGVTYCGTNGCSRVIPQAEGDVSLAKDDYAPRTPSALGEGDGGCGNKGCYFVLGDNRPNSSDSRQGWLVPAENIVGFVEVD